jgi:hypothetical protein
VTLNAQLAVAAGRLRYLAEQNGIDDETVKAEWEGLLAEVEDSRSRGSAELAIAVKRARWERRWGR